ncbi:MAG TPA: hypothetical protein VMV83_01395 [Rectinemataceae bacterium]|nr:hypothetical protein [Rectinemataceae bacterium]
MKRSQSQALLLGSIAGIALFSLLGCSLDGAGISVSSATSHSLTISNSSSSALSFVRWTDGKGVKQVFSPDTIYDATLQKTVGGMLPGSKATQAVAPGSNPLLFFFADGGVEYRTVGVVTVDSSAKETIFVLTDATATTINQ